MMEAERAMQQSLLQYLRHRVMPILEPLQFDVMTHQPADLHEFSYLWLQNYKEGHSKEENLTSEDEEEPDEQFFERLKKKGRRCKGRKGISGEIYSSYKSVEYKKFEGEKYSEEKIEILIRLRNFILFKNLSEQNILELIHCMKTRHYKTNDIVVREGEMGNELFLVVEGEFSCEANENEEGKIYERGSAFGELSLLYNTPRATTIIARTDGRLFSLDRGSHNSILRDSVLKKNKLCEDILNRNELFSTMKPYEKCKLIQNIKQISVGTGKYVIRQGQLGDRFYIVGEGKLVAEKVDENGQNKSVLYYKEGDYFGQIALIRNVPRQASIKALTSSKLFFIERSAFKRLLGPLEQILKRNEEKYRSLKMSVKKKFV